MQANQLIKKIKAHKGKLLVPVHSLNGTMHVAVEKKDLIEQLLPMGNGECGYCMVELDNGFWCVEADHDAN